jgi:L-lactate dehydrogenase complex protein LldG
MSRDAILTRVRAAGAATAERAISQGAAPQSLTTAGDVAIARFRTMAAAKGIIIIDAAARGAVPHALATCLSTTGIETKPIRLNDPAMASLMWEAMGLSIELGAAEPQDIMALSTAVAAVAETGTLMLCSGADNPETLALLPETHIIVIDAMTIVGTFEDALRILRNHYGASLPRAVNLISGASRTGDIGGRIVHGAHGPRRLIVVIVANEIRAPQPAP